MEPHQREATVPTKILEEYKVHHSMQLTSRIHEEAQAQFKQIRQERLNNLVIERMQSKNKPKSDSCTLTRGHFAVAVKSPSVDGLRGKAGKSRYAILVGEVQNLYKTTKPSAMKSHGGPSFILDLHGHPRAEALTNKLDGSLGIWVDAAMQVSYVSLQSTYLVCICGCRNQILSKTVQE